MKWRDSRAVGTPNAGSLENGVRLPSSGAGYYTYNPATQAAPGRLRPHLGHRAAGARGDRPRGVVGADAPEAAALGIGDLSRETGGPFTGPVVGHQSHQNGLDVDIRLVRRDGARGGRGRPSTYDRALTQASSTGSSHGAPRWS